MSRTLKKQTNKQTKPKEQNKMPKRTKIIMNECKNATSEDQMYRIMEELTRIKKIDLTFKGVKVA